MAKKNVKKITKTIVCFGGGSGITKYLIGGLKRSFRVVATTSMVDNGMSTGQLRRDLDVLPPGDLVKQLAAVSDAPEWKIKLWRKRFGREEFTAGHVGHTFGNLFLAGIENITGDFTKALAEAEKFLVIKKHRAYPATTDNVQLLAELEDGQVIEGEDEIDEPAMHDPAIGIKRVFLKPAARAFRPLLGEIAGADIITFGPSDFYSSLIPCLLPEGMSAALRRSEAKKVFIANTVTENGETNGFTAERFVSELEKYMGCPLDYVLVQYPPVAPHTVAEWKKDNPDIIEAVEFAGAYDQKKYLPVDILKDGGEFGYDPKKLDCVISTIANKRYE